MKQPGAAKIYSLISKLREANISYSLEVNRDDAITILVVVPGQRWEVDVFADGEVDVEVFRSNGDIYGVEELAEMIRMFADDAKVENDE